MLKDILAFANAWRRADAYILRGVEEVRGGRSNVVGVSEHLDDHSLQQFVSHLTNRPPQFSYEAFTFEGKQVGIIKTDDKQARPFYLKADYGTRSTGFRMLGRPLSAPPVAACKLTSSWKRPIASRGRANTTLSKPSGPT